MKENLFYEHTEKSYLILHKTCMFFELFGILKNKKSKDIRSVFRPFLKKSFLFLPSAGPL